MAPDLGKVLDHASTNKCMLLLSISHCKIYAQTDKISGAFLGGNSTADKITISHNQYHKSDKPYINLVAGTNIILSHNKNISK
jgi:hypothetical protein